MSTHLEANSLLKFTWHLRNIEIDKPAINVEIDQNGKLNWTNLIAKFNENSDPENKKITPLIIDALSIKEGAVYYVNNLSHTHFRSTIKPLSIELNDISTLPKDRGDYLISAKILDQNTTLRWKGEFTFNPLSSSGEIDVQRLNLINAIKALGISIPEVNLNNGFVNTKVNYDLKIMESNGKQYPVINLKKPKIELYDLNASFKNVNNINIQSIDFNLAQLLINGQSPELFQINKLNAKVSKLNLTTQNQKFFSLNNVELQGLSFDMKEHQLSLEKILADKGEVTLIKNANGTSNISNLSDAIFQRAGNHNSEASPLKVEIGQLIFKDWVAHLNDLSSALPLKIDLKSINLDSQLGIINNFRALPYHLNFKVINGGDIDLIGKTTLSTLKTDIDLNVKDFAIKPFSPYLSAYALLKIDDGALNLKGKLIAFNQPTSSLKFKGEMSLNQVIIKESETANNFVSWDELSTKSLSIGINPNQMHVDELRLMNPIGKLIIGEDNTLNAKKLIRQKSPKSPLNNTTNPVGEAGDFPVSIDRFVIRNADLAFADLSLKPQFGAQINSLNGVINNLNSNQSATAQLELNGKVDEYGSVTIRGGLQPFRATDFTDIKLNFANLEMSKLTPYSGKFAGRKIESGKLSADFEYKIKNHALIGANKIVINKIKLGDHVDSIDASNLPLDLAIFLLEDSNGMIDLDVPISGNLDDPKFSYGKIIWKAIVNVLEKVATSPFRSLGKLLGIDTSKVDGVAFEPGSFSLLPSELEKLKILSEGINKKAKMILTITPTYHPIKDTPALKEILNRKDIAREMGLNIHEGDIFGPIDMNNPKTQIAIENVLKARMGQGSNNKVLSFIKSYYKKLKPDDSAKISNMAEQLNSTVVISEKDYLELANMRAQVIHDYLINTLAMDQARIKILEPTPLDEADQLQLKLGLTIPKN